MKKISVFLASVIVLGLTMVSCTKDEAEVSIEGKWNHESVTFFIEGVEKKDPIVEYNTPGCNKTYIIFNSGGEAESGSYTDTSCTLTKVFFNWSKERNVLTLKDGSVTYIYSIETLSDTTLKIKNIQIDNGVKVERILLLSKDK